MPFVLLLLLTLACLQANWPEPPSWLDPISCTLATWLGVTLLLYLGGSWAKRLGQKLKQDPSQRGYCLRRFSACRRFHFFFLLGFYLFALYFLGWGWTVKNVLPLGVLNQEMGGRPIFFPGLELVVLAPYLTGLLFSWAHYYEVEQAVQPPNPEGEPPFLGRWAYVGLQARHNLLLVVPPLFFLLIQQTVFFLFPSLGGNRGFQALLLVLLLSGAFISIPMVLRIFLQLKPLPEGPLRTRLLAAAARLQFRFSDVLIWNTRGTLANAMVTGPLPWLRYVVLTDRLIEDLTPAEVEAVFGHEVGHIKHHHLFFYVVFLVASLALLTGIWNTTLELFFRWGNPLVWYPEMTRTFQIFGDIPLLLLVATYIFLVFGYISRRCEGQADVYGSMLTSWEVFIDALEKVASLNGIHRERPGWFSSWQHGTIAQRVEFLKQMHQNPTLEPAFQKRVGRLKWGVALTLGALLLLLGTTGCTLLGKDHLWDIFKEF